MGTMSTQIATSSAAIQEPLTLHQHEARKAKRVPPEDETPSLTASVSEDYSGLLDARALAANQQFLQSPPRKKMKHGGPNSSLYGLSLRPSRLSLRTLVTPQVRPLNSREREIKYMDIASGSEWCGCNKNVTQNNKFSPPNS